MGQTQGSLLVRPVAFFDSSAVVSGMSPSPSTSSTFSVTSETGSGFSSPSTSETISSSFSSSSSARPTRRPMPHSCVVVRSSVATPLPCWHRLPLSERRRPSLHRATPPCFPARASSTHLLRQRIFARTTFSFEEQHNMNLIVVLQGPTPTMLRCTCIFSSLVAST